jgi:hypothetical protein
MHFVIGLADNVIYVVDTHHEPSFLELNGNGIL